MDYTCSSYIIDALCLLLFHPSVSYLQFCQWSFLVTTLLSYNVYHRYMHCFFVICVSYSNELVIIFPAFSIVKNNLSYTRAQARRQTENIHILVFFLLQRGLITTKERDGTQPAPFSYWEFYKHTQRSFPKGGQHSCAYLLSLLFAQTHTHVLVCVFLMWYLYNRFPFFNLAYFCLF